jgi:integrase
MKITIEVRKGRLVLRWNDGNKRHNLSTGAYDNPIGRAQAERKRAEIQTDWEAGYYDATLVKYRPKTRGKNASEITAVQLFDRFAAHQMKQKGLTQRSIDTRYKPIARMLEKHLDKPANLIGKRDAEAFALIAERTLSGRTARERVWLLCSAWEWARDRYSVDNINPWEGIHKRFNVDERQPVKHFTEDELRMILSAFINHSSYNHYADYVSFLINTACRPGEAAGLCWKHLGTNYTTAWIGESLSRGTRGATKNKKVRTVPLSLTIQNMLAARFEQLKPSPNDLVFPSPKGGAINDQNFRPRAWTKILEKCSIEYRRPYALRHSAITHALENGANPNDIAKLAGHSLSVLLKTYDHAIPKKHLFLEV